MIRSRPRPKGMSAPVIGVGIDAALGRIGVEPGSPGSMLVVVPVAPAVVVVVVAPAPWFEGPFEVVEDPPEPLPPVEPMVGPPLLWPDTPVTPAPELPAEAGSDELEEDEAVEIWARVEASVVVEESLLEESLLVDPAAEELVVESVVVLVPAPVLCWVLVSELVELLLAELDEELLSVLVEELVWELESLLLSELVVLELVVVVVPPPVEPPVEPGQSTQKVTDFDASWDSSSLKWKPCFAWAVSPAFSASATRVDTATVAITWGSEPARA